MSGNEYKKGRITGTVKILPPQPAKTLPSKAEIQLSKMPGIPINYTSVQTYRGVPQPSMTNYALQIQLSKISDASVMKPSELNYKKAWSADGTTPEMLEAYKQMERADLYKQGIFRPNYDIDLINIPDEERLKEMISIETENINQGAENAKRGVQRDYDEVQRQNTDLLRQKANLRVAYNRMSGQEQVESREAFQDATDQLDIALGETRRQLNTFIGAIGTIETEKKKYLEELNDAVTQYYEAKKTNDKTFRKYEEDLRSLNQGFIVGRMVGESDEDYKERLLTFERENVEAITQQEAAMYNNMVFKTNLKKVVRLPVHLEEELLKKLGQANLFSINEKWPLYEKKFIETYGKFPIMGERNSLVNFFTSVVPLRAPSKSEPEVIEVRAPSKVDPRFASTRATAPTREQFFSTRPAGTRSIGTQLRATTISPDTRDVGTQLRAATISKDEKPDPENPVDFRPIQRQLKKDELVYYIRSNGGRANMGMSKFQLQEIASNL
jgi:hypothetical protein